MTLEIDKLARAMTGPLGEALFLELHQAPWIIPKTDSVDRFGASYASHPGLVRARNEDRLALAQISAANGDTYFIAVVCDGVGGSDHGDLAAAIAVTTLISELAYSKVRLSAEDALRHTIRKMDDKVRDCLKGKGTTTASIVMANSAGEFVGANIGDSRVITWDYEDSKLTQVSTDDTLENELKKLKLDAGALYGKGLMGSLSQAVGEVGRDSYGLSIKILPKVDFKNRILLASDGLWKKVSDAFEIVVLNSKTGLECVRRTTALAAWAGGIDNSSVIVIDDVEALIAKCAASSSNDGSMVGASVWFLEEKFHYHERIMVPRAQPDAIKPNRILRKSARKPRAKLTETSKERSGGQLDLTVDGPAAETSRRATGRARIEISVEDNDKADD